MRNTKLIPFTEEENEIYVKWMNKWSSEGFLNLPQALKARMGQGWDSNPNLLIPSPDFIWL